MSDIENELRELLDEDASRAPLPRRPPRPLLRRTRRRQAALVVASAVTVAAVVFGSIAGLQVLLGKPAKIAPAQGPSRTTTLVGVTITTPRSWPLADLWPLAMSIATGTSGSVGQTTPSPIAVPTGLPVFQVSNYDAGLVPACGTGTSVPSDGALLYVALDSDQVQGLTKSPRPPDWPVALSETATDGPCGTGLYARWQTGGNAFFASAMFGPDVSATDRQVLLDAFNGMSVRAVDLSPPVLSSPAYVIASGVAGSDPWNLLVSPTDGRGPEIAVESTAKGPSGNGGSLLDIAVPNGKDLEGAMVTQGDSTFDWGAVSDRVERIEVRLDDGRTIVGDIVPMPSSMGAPFDAFVVVVPNATQGRIVALDANGAELASEQFVGQAPSRPGCPVEYPPAPTGAPLGAGGDTMETESSLRNALVVAKTSFTDCASYAGFGPDTAYAMEPSLAYDTSSTATPGVISIRDVSATTVLLVTATADGRPFCIADDTTVGTTYGTVDAQTVAECSDLSWP